MSDEVIKILDALAERFGIVIDWSSENVLPYLKDVAHRFVNYTAAMSVLKIILCIICIAVLIKVIKEMNKRPNFGVEKYVSGYDDSTGRYFLYAGCYIAIAFLSIYLIANLFTIITCVTFPEKLFIRELQALTKKGCV